MPTYEYACKSCDEHLEVVQSFKDAPLSTCPACGGPLRKVFGAIGIAFKGSGFYRNDSRPKPASEASSSSSEGGSKGTDGKAADTKATGKTDTPKASPKGDTKAAAST